MKKTFIVLIVIFLTSCTKINSNINKNIYVASIGLEKNDDGYSAYFYFPSSIDVGSLEENSNINTICRSKGKKIEDLFLNMDSSTTLNVNYKHLNTLILSSSMLNDYTLVFNYIFNNKKFDINFYVISTIYSFDNIFNLKNIDNQNITYSLLLEPYNNKQFTNIKPISFLTCSKLYFLNERIVLPNIKPVSLFSDNFDSLIVDGYLILNNNSTKRR